MKLRTVVRDCLFLNWALPVAALPEPPAPLRYQRHEWQGAEYVFASALLFHHDAVRWSAFPLLRVGYPQLNVRLYVLDEDGVPSVLFLRELMPAWVAPGVRLVSRHPAASARLDFPRPSRQAEAASWQWRARFGSTLKVRAWVHSPGFGQGPRIGSWEETVRYIQDRPRGYAEHDGVLHRVNASHPPADAVWPLAAEIEGGDAMLRRLLPLAQGFEAQNRAPNDGHGLAGGTSTRTLAVGAQEGAPALGAAGSAGSSSATAVLAVPGSATAPGAAAPAGFSWPALHSSWLCPEMPFSVVFDLVPKVQPVVNGLPHPAAGRISSPALRGASPRPPGTAPAAPAIAAEMGAASGVLASAA